MIRDPFGDRWALGAHVEEVSREEVMARMKVAGMV
jgi:hypothetical protein